jgi:hypothetical protein
MGMMPSIVSKMAFDRARGFASKICACIPLCLTENGIMEGLGPVAEKLGDRLARG